MLLDAHADCARPSRFFLPLIINAIAHRFAPLFEVGDLSTEKGDTDIGGLNFRDQPASHLFAGPLFWANYRCCAFLHNLFASVMLSWTLARGSMRHRQDAACAGRFVQCLQPTLEC